MDEFWTENQKENIAFFKSNIETWWNNPLYKFKFAVISNKEIKGIFDTFENALGDAAVKYQQGDYIIQQIISDEETVNFLYPALAWAAA